MRKFVILLGAAMLGYAVLPSAAHAQVIVVQSGRPYAPPIIVAQPAYAAPVIRTYSSGAVYSYYPAPTTVYAAPRTVVTYSAPATQVVPVAGVVETRTYYGYGILRPRGYYSESRFYP